MTIYSTIETHFGEDVAVYIRNKHTGGHSGKKGSRYEDFFLVYKVAMAIADMVSGKYPGVIATISSQTPSILDDVCVSSSQQTEHYQCKNVEGITWQSGVHPLITDFEYQFRLSAILKETNPTTHLVLSCPQLANNRRADIPEQIAIHTKVEYFPWYERPNVLVQQHRELRDQLAQISIRPNPSLDILANIFAYILGAAVVAAPNSSASDLWEMAHTLGPSSIRRPDHLPSIDSRVIGEFEIILGNIPGLNYIISHGIFTWSGFGLDGVISSDVSSPTFQTFQESIIKGRPQTFDDFEALLP